MTRGRKPKPTRLKLITGNPGNRPLNEDEPKVEKKKGCPRAPRHMSDGAKEGWRKLAPMLHEAGLLSKVDELALEACCEAYGRWRQAQDQVREFGPLIKTPSGIPIQSPYLQIANKAFEQMTRMLTEFGLTPSSRSRIRQSDLPL